MPQILCPPRRGEPEWTSYLITPLESPREAREPEPREELREPVSGDSVGICLRASGTGYPGRHTPRVS
jgi:hypothetical protein